MALAFAPTKAGDFTGGRPDHGLTQTDVTLDGTSYSTGFAITAANLGLNRLDQVVSITSVGGTAVAGISLIWDNNAGKIRGFKNAAGAGLLAESVAGDYSTSNVLRVEARGVPRL